MHPETNSWRDGFTVMAGSPDDLAALNAEPATDGRTHNAALSGPGLLVRDPLEALGNARADVVAGPQP